MTIALWILYSLLAINIPLYIVGFCKEKSLIVKISSTSILPLLCIANVLLLLRQLPDSYHTLVITILSYIAVIGSQNTFNLEKRILNQLFRILFLASIILWCSLYASCFYIYRVSSLFIVIYLLSCVLISVISCFFSKRQKLGTYITFIICVFLCGALSLFGLVFLVYGKKISAILLYAGTLVNIALVVFNFFDFQKVDSKFGKPIKLLLLVAGQTLISYSNVLLLW